jgi:hypothetical protein
MAGTLFRAARTMALAFGLAACGDEDVPRADETLDATVDVESPVATIEPVDAASCDPLAFEQTLEASPANVAAALQQRCFNTGEGRRVLVIDALCAHDAMCGFSHADDCRDEYESRWQERLRPRGLTVPCMDAMLDSMSCTAQVSCGDTKTCKAASVRAETECDPNIPRGPRCPPLPNDRELTKGPIPDDAINDAGMRDETRIPDFVPVWDQSGEAVAGYVRYCAIGAGGAIPVYDDDLETIVGYMIPGRGFVPGALP